MVKTLTLSAGWSGLGSCFSGLGLLQGLYARNDHGVHDRGNGDEEEVLKEEPLRIDPKKVEIKTSRKPV